MIAAFIARNGVTACPPHRVSHAGPSANGHPSPEAFLFRAAGIARTPEQRLASAKLLVMFQDLGGKCQGEGGGYRAKARSIAEHWFFDPGSDFDLWCETAAIDPDDVRRHARRVLERGLPQTRARSGEGKRYAERRAYRLTRERTRT